MTSDKSRNAGELVNVGLSLIKTVSVIANDDISRDQREEFCVKQAELELRNRQLRVAFFPNSFFGEPAWQMLLELYIAHYQRDQFTVTNLCIASNEPQTTALRWIDILETEGLIYRLTSRTDKRLKFIRITGAAIERLDQYFLKRTHHLI